MNETNPDTKSQDQKPRVSALKVAVIVVAALCLGCGALAVVGGLFSQSMFEGMEEVHRAGETFALSSDQEGCLREGLSRAERCGLMAVSCKLHVPSFVGVCLQSAAPTPDFCADLPAPPQGPGESWTMPWITERCEELGHPLLSNNSCLHVVTMQLDFCDSQ